MSGLIPFMRRHTFGDWIYDFDRLFEPVLPAGESYSLRGDIEETDEHILLSFDFPGMKESDLNVKVEENVLTLSGERKREIKGEEESAYKYFGREYGKFHKQFTLPKNINKDKIEADYQDGVLRILLPKLEEKKPEAKSIKIGNKSSLIEKLVGTKE